MPVVTLYRRDGCLLCDEAERMLLPIARRLGFEVALADIERDDALLVRYMLTIPVVAVEGRDLAAWPFTSRMLEGALRDFHPGQPVNT